MILVTQKDGTAVALNVDRIERIEANPVSAGSNIFFVGGAHLVVHEPQGDLVERVIDAKALVHARSSALTDHLTADGPPRPAGNAVLRVVNAPAPATT